MEMGMEMEAATTETEIPIAIQTEIPTAIPTATENTIHRSSHPNQSNQSSQSNTQLLSARKKANRSGPARQSLKQR